jgi:hypothetical protein
MSRWLRNPWIWFGLLIVVLHCGIVFIAIPAVSSRLLPGYNKYIFADGYDQLAANLIAGKGYRFYPDTALTLMREPGFPVLLAGLFLVFGQNILAIKIVNVILAFITAWLTVRITKRLLSQTILRDSFLLFVPPLLFLFNPGTLVAEGRGGVEIIFGFLIAVFILTIYRAIDRGRLWDYAVSGAVLGVTVLVRSTPMLFPMFLLAYQIFLGAARTSKIVICRNVAVMIAVMMCVMSPWIIRNYSLTGRFVPTASVMGVSAQAGQYINEHLFEGKPWWLLDREASRERDKVAAKLGLPFEDGAEGYYQTFYKSNDEIKFSQFLFAAVVNEYKRSPMLLVRSVAQNVFDFWFAGRTWTVTAVNALVQLPYMILAGIGIAYSVKSRGLRSIGPVLLFIGYILAVHVPILAQARYSVPLMPLICSLGAVGLIAMHRRAAIADVTSLVASSARP